MAEKRIHNPGKSSSADVSRVSRSHDQDGHHTHISDCTCWLSGERSLPLGYLLFQVNILLLDNKLSHFLFITDYMTVAETVDIVAK